MKCNKKIFYSFLIVSILSISQLSPMFYLIKRLNGKRTESTSTQQQMDVDLKDSVIIPIDDTPTGMSKTSIDSTSQQEELATPYLEENDLATPPPSSDLLDIKMALSHDKTQSNNTSTMTILNPETKEIATSIKLDQSNCCQRCLKKYQNCLECCGGLGCCCMCCKVNCTLAGSVLFALTPLLTNPDESIPILHRPTFKPALWAATACLICGSICCYKLGSRGSKYIIEKVKKD